MSPDLDFELAKRAAGGHGPDHRQAMTVAELWSLLKSLRLPLASTQALQARRPIIQSLEGAAPGAHLP